ncbi:hypothetical protein [Geomicrobium sediminis]|uniref:Uncharacterized protein n=1 Tax=Geomicrobium sediminis TaxID=1347788 RepID=A0ABS2P6D3_9BACL|nr:hypothetical protein [Geomicrobium sediminis]MBM7630953.1 hypothetical protein [Geomicrobium sediminis]
MLHSNNSESRNKPRLPIRTFVFLGLLIGWVLGYWIMNGELPPMSFDRANNRLMIILIAIIAVAIWWRFFNKGKVKNHHL